MELIHKPCLVLLGAAGAGKDTVAKMIDEFMYGTEPPLKSGKLRFSQPLKHVVATMFGLDEERMNDLEYKETLMEMSVHVPPMVREATLRPPQCLRTPRELLQWFGTDFGREIDPDIWVNAALARAVRVAPLMDHFICTDCRFKNEWRAIERTFDDAYFVKLERVGREVLTGQTAKHASEVQVLDHDKLYHIMDGDFDSLRAVAREIAEEFLIR